MFRLGYIGFVSQTGGGFDSDKNPIKPTDVESVILSCNFKVLSHEYRTVVDGQLLNSSYKILIDQNEIKLAGLDYTQYSFIQLYDINLGFVGLFQIQSKFPLVYTGRVKIIV